MRRKIIFIFAFLTILFLTPTQVKAKSYSITSDKFEISINKDKSIDVVEHLTYDFDGSFTWAEMWIPTKVSRKEYAYDTNLIDFSVRSADESPVKLLESNKQNNRFYAKWSYKAQNEKKTFLIQYRVENAIRKYEDVAELYWQIIGSDWKIPHHNVEITVKLPSPVESKENLLVYGHGPLNGKSEIVDLQTARFLAERVASGQFMEIRVIFPTSLVLGNLDGGEKLLAIKEEEKQFVEQTIKAAKKQQQITRIILSWVGFTASVPILWIFLYYFFGKNTARNTKLLVFQNMLEIYHQILILARLVSF